MSFLKEGDAQPLRYLAVARFGLSSEVRRLVLVYWSVDARLLAQRSNGKCPREILMHHVFTDLVQKYYAEVDKGDVEGVVALFEVDAEYSRPGYAHMSGREAIRSFYADDRIIESGVHNVESIVSDPRSGSCGDP